jgi:hypothetical protein
MSTSVQHSSADLLAALTFWEEYPRNLSVCRSAVALIEEHRDQVAVFTREKANRKRVIPATHIAPTLRVRGQRQWVLRIPNPPVPKDKVVYLFRMIALVIGPLDDVNAPCHLVPASYTRVDGAVKEITIGETELNEAHQDAERILCPALERRGIDSSSLVISGRVCRSVCQTFPWPPLAPEFPANPAGPPKRISWPSAAADRLDRLHPSDVAAIVEAERSLIRLRTQLTSEARATNAARRAEEPPPPPAKTANSDRDEWIYGKCRKLVPYDKIVRQLADCAKKKKWEPIGTIQGVVWAAKRYAKAHDLSPIPSRQPGRRK